MRTCDTIGFRASSLGVMHLQFLSVLIYRADDSLKIGTRPFGPQWHQSPAVLGLSCIMFNLALQVMIAALGRSWGG